MILKCLGSGSSGNCYLLCHNEEVLILDAGIPIKAIKKALNWQLGGIKAVLVSHGHHDHDLSVKDFKSMGIEVFQPYLSDNKSQYRKFGSFSVQSFEVPHDNEPCCGMMITCADGQKLLYITDFEYCSYVFRSQNINHILIEANHSKDLLDREKANYAHSIRGHASIDTTCKFLEVNKTSHLRTVILVHLSSECGDEKMFKEMVEKIVDCTVYVAKARLEVELSKFPF